jgi:hypothetical protein
MVKTLYAWDLDDTLIMSKSEVIIKNNSAGTMKILTPAEFAIYEPKPGEKLDFSQFDNLIHPEILKKNFDLFSRILKKTVGSKDSKTIILTARTPKVERDILMLLKSKGLPGIKIYAVGSSDPMAKVNVIQNYIDDGYERVRFYDDSAKNARAVNEMKKENPSVDIKAKLIVSH